MDWNIFKFELEVEPEDMSPFLICLSRIGVLIEKGMPVPAEDLKELLSYLKDTHNLIENKTFREAALLAFESRAYFEGTIYNFEVTVDGFSYSLMGILNLVFIDLKSNSEIAGEKGSAIKHVHKMIYDYIPMVRGKRILTDHKIRIITGYIPGKLGVLSSEDEFLKSDKSGTYKKYLDDRVVYYTKNQ